MMRLRYLRQLSIFDFTQELVGPFKKLFNGLPTRLPFYSTFTLVLSDQSSDLSARIPCHFMRKRLIRPFSCLEHVC
jgi:hypothetical protein